MLQSKATVSLDGQMSKEDMSSLLKSSGAGNLLQVGASERLAAAQKMERSMEALAAKMTNGSYNYSLANEIYDGVLAELHDMETEVLEGKNNLQTQVNNANGAVVTCNANMNATLDGVVASAKVDANNNKNKHGACRGAEVSASSAKNESCGDLADDTTKTSKAAPECNCAMSPTTDTAAVLDCLAKNDAWVNEYESDLTAQRDDCNAKTETWSNKSAECDRDQTNYEDAVCSYDEELESMCSELDICYNDAIAARTAVVQSTQVEEEHIKAVLASAKKVVCYLGILKRSGTENLTMSDFDKCKNMDAESDKTYLSTSVPELDIAYTPAVAKQACETLPTTPGEKQWADDEYAAYRKDWLRETVVCPHKTTTPTQAAPTWNTNGWSVPEFSNGGRNIFVNQEGNWAKSNFANEDISASGPYTGIKFKCNCDNSAHGITDHAPSGTHDWDFGWVFKCRPSTNDAGLCLGDIMSTNSDPGGVFGKRFIPYASLSSVIEIRITADNKVEFWVDGAKVDYTSYFQAQADKTYKYAISWFGANATVEDIAYIGVE